MNTLYEPPPSRIERVAAENRDRLTTLGFNILEPPEGTVVAVNVSVDPPQIIGVYTVEEFDARFSPISD